MFTRLVTALTLAATLIHSALGCCWHHNHSAGSQHSAGCSRRSTAASPKAACCSHNHKRHDADRGASDAPQPCDHSHGGCIEPNCVYVRADDGSELNHAEWSMALPPPQVAVPTPVHHGIAESLRVLMTPRAPAPELRALLQVWLI